MASPKEGHYRGVRKRPWGHGRRSTSGSAPLTPPRRPPSPTTALPAPSAAQRSISSFKTRFLGSITKSSLRSLLPMATRSISSFKRRNPDPKLNPKTRKSVTSYSSENTPPSDPNVRIDANPSHLHPQKPPLQVEIVQY